MANIDFFFKVLTQSLIDTPIFPVTKQIPNIEGVVNEDLPNSWECPKCCKEGKNIEYKV